MNSIQGFLHTLEVGRGRILVTFVPLVIAIVSIVGLLDHGILRYGPVYHGLGDAQSMDNAQLARQIVRGEGFTTEFLRPYAVKQLATFATAQNAKTGAPVDLFPADKFPPGKPRILPDTYNAPAYPYLLAGWFMLVHANFDQTAAQLANTHIYSPDNWIPLLNQLLLLLTAGMIAGLGYRLFDLRVAWVAALSFLVTNLVWSYSLTGLSTTLLMLLTTGFLFLALEVFSVGDDCFTSEDAVFWPAWLWALGAAMVLGLMCLTRLNLVILIIPFLVLCGLTPKTNLLLLPMVFLIVAAMVGPWFWHNYQVCGDILGSNAPLVVTGEDGYNGNEIYCQTSIPGYERIFKDAGRKEFLGFLYYFEHAWELSGSNPMVLFFAASLLHQFRRSKAQAFRFLLLGCVVAAIFINNLANSSPEAVSPWNILPIFLPGMLVIGSAFFFILLDRLNIEVEIISTTLVTCVLLLTSASLTLSILFASPKYYNYPPYMPPFINLITRMAHPDEWVTSDLPWATAWYGDRPSLWLPDSTTDFEDMHDNYCPTGILLFSSNTLDAPLSSLTTGEEKAWGPFVLGTALPAHFPLLAHTTPPQGGPHYSIWSNSPRWQ